MVFGETAEQIAGEGQFGQNPPRNDGGNQGGFRGPRNQENGYSSESNGQAYQHSGPARPSDNQGAHGFGSQNAGYDNSRQYGPRGHHDARHEQQAPRGEYNQNSGGYNDNRGRGRQSPPSQQQQHQGPRRDNQQEFDRRDRYDDGQYKDDRYQNQSRQQNFPPGRARQQESQQYEGYRASNASSREYNDHREDSYNRRGSDRDFERNDGFRGNGAPSHRGPARQYDTPRNDRSSRDFDQQNGSQQFGRAGEQDFGSRGGGRREQESDSRNRNEEFQGQRGGRGFSGRNENSSAYNRPQSQNSRRNEDYESRNSGFQGFRGASRGDRSDNYERNDRSFQGFGGASHGGRNGDDFGRPRGDSNVENLGGYEPGSNFRIMDNGQERAPRDWIPEEKDVDVLLQESRENVQDLNIDEDQKLEIRNSNNDTKLSSWENSGLNPSLLLTLKRCGYTNVRPIQAAVIPQIRSGHDLMGQAETGGGKTAAFALPILDAILKIPQEQRDTEGRASSPYVFVVAPTRELVKQLYESFRKYADRTGILIKFCYGEYDRRQNLRDISSGCHILVGTPGRMMDFLSKSVVYMGLMRFFVIDEADELLEKMDAGEHMATIVDDNLRRIKHQVQTLLFSATFSSRVEDIAHKLLRPSPVKRDDFVRVVLAQGRLNPRVQLQFIKTNGAASKQQEIKKIFRNDLETAGKVPRTLVFVERRDQTGQLAVLLNLEGKNCFKVDNMHGQRGQDAREKTLKDFKGGVNEVLVGTDVCARGLDVRDLDRVIVYDLPLKSVECAADTFIHRVGRTGRMRKGVAISFVDELSQRDIALVPTLISLLRSAKQEVPDWMLRLSSRTNEVSHYKHGSEPNEQRGSSQFGATGFKQDAFASAFSNAAKASEGANGSSDGASKGGTFGLNSGSGGFASSGLGFGAKAAAPPPPAQNDDEKKEIKAGSNIGFGGGFGGFTKAKSAEPPAQDEEKQKPKVESPVKEKDSDDEGCLFMVPAGPSANATAVPSPPKSVVPGRKGRRKGRCSLS